MPALPTVKVKFGDGYIVINESDYDPKKHELVKGSKSKAKKEAPVEVDATDSARSLAEENDIDLSTVDRTGKDGRVLKSDVAEVEEKASLPGTASGPKSKPRKK